MICASSGIRYQSVLPRETGLVGESSCIHLAYWKGYGMKITAVFLASSDELVGDRIGIGDFFRELNNILVPRGEYLKLIKWEWGSHAIAPTRKQEEYNELLREADLCLLLFCTKLGEYTREEFNVALGAYEQKGAPKLTIWFRKVPEGQTMSPELQKFTDQLGKLKLLWNAYDTLDALKLGILTQLKLDGLGEVEDALRVRDPTN